MRFIFAMNLCYQPAIGGAAKANRIIAEMLAERGHAVMVVATAASDSSVNVPALIRKYGSPSGERTQHVSPLTMDGVCLHAVPGSPYQLSKHLAERLEEFRPDCVLISTEDPMQLMLSATIRYGAARVVYIAHTPSCLPFGPHSFDPSEVRSELFKRVDVIVAVSRFCKDYITKSSTLNPKHLYLPVYGEPPFPSFGEFGQGYVTLINPCTYKGVDIFLDLARVLPSVPFAAVASWGTTARDRQRLRQLPNVEIFESLPDIDSIFQRTKILLVPSLWLENFPMVVVEAMLRGIPVMGSNVGGIPEAMLGTGYVVPVRPITKFTREWDDRKLWIPIVPSQDIELWVSALTELLSNHVVYERESGAMKCAAQEFVASLSFGPLEGVLCRS